MLGLAKIAADRQRKQEELSGKEMAGWGAIGAGGLAGVAGVPHLRSTETLYHGTDTESAKGIRESGLLASHAERDDTVTKDTGVWGQGGNEEAYKGKTYVTRNKPLAKSIGFNSALIRGEDPEIVKFNIPKMDLREGVIPTAPNPELMGMTRDQYAEHQINLMRGNIAQKVQLNMAGEDAYRDYWGKVYDGLDYPNTVTIEGDLSSKYIPGSANYQRQTLEDYMNYVRKYPAEFGKGLGLAALGAGGIGLGAHLINQAHQE